MPLLRATWQGKERASLIPAPHWPHQCHGGGGGVTLPALVTPPSRGRSCLLLSGAGCGSTLALPSPSSSTPPPCSGGSLPPGRGKSPSSLPGPFRCHLGGRMRCSVATWPGLANPPCDVQLSKRCCCLTVFCLAGPPLGQAFVYRQPALVEPPVSAFGQIWVAVSSAPSLRCMKLTHKQQPKQPESSAPCCQLGAQAPSRSALLSPPSRVFCLWISI